MTTKQSNRRDCFAALTTAALIFFWALPSFALESTLFEQANEKYRAADFQAAADLYQKILKSGNATSAVYYNLGNAMLRLGEKGEALVYYKRALKAIPRDKDLQWNIQLLQSALPDRIEESSLNLPRFLLRKVTEPWTLEEIGYLFTAALAVLAALALLDFALPLIQALTGFLRPLIFLLLLASAALFGFKWWDTKDPRAVILDKEVNAFYGPSDRETKAFVLHEGAEGKILDTSGDWVYIALKNKNTGWIRKNACEIV